MDNFDDLLKRLQISKKAIEQGLNVGVKKAGLLIEADAKILCPVDTGQLRASINTNVTRKSENITANIGTNVKHAPFNEFGTGQKGDQSVPHRQDWAGMPPQPFLRPSYNYNVQSGNVNKIISNEVNKALRKVMI